MPADPFQLSFWSDELNRAWAEFAPLMLRIIFSGGQSGADLLPSGMDILVDWDVFNQYAIDWVHDWGKTFLKGIEEHTQVQVVNAMTDWIRSGEHLDVLEAKLTPLFGDVRAARIAATEVTRAYAEGNLAAWRSSGLVGGKRWNTAFDERVCPQCGPLNGKIVSLDDGWTMDAGGNIVGGLGILAPPLHTACRCFLTPVVTELSFDEALRRALNG